MATIRFIPACAGNTQWKQRSRNRQSVHPRMCGEHSACKICASNASGSSPHVRGTQKRPQRGCTLCRFIPACAGNTPLLVVVLEADSVHPRMCGEHGETRLKGSSTAGSSPHVRGTPWRVGGAWGLRRFIPACAGNTPIRRSPPPKTPVHPRMCGEHRQSRSSTR